MRFHTPSFLTLFRASVTPGAAISAKHQPMTTTTSSLAASAAASVEPEEYVPPKVWKLIEAPENAFSSINRPTAGARYEKKLPVGKHPLQLYSMATPNGQKVTILLEELLEAGYAGAEYDAWPIKIMEGDQFGSDFVGLNPNSKIPALADYSNSNQKDDAQRVFESGSILLYLAEKFDGAFLPADKRTEVLNWLFWQMGSAPYLGGGFGHFYAYAEKKQEYPIDRFTMETKRQLDVLDRQLADNTYIAGGDDYTIADISIFPWYGGLVLGRLYGDAATFLNVEEDYPNVVRWAKQIAARKAVIRGSIVNKFWGEEGQLEERHEASDIDDAIEKNNIDDSE